MTEGSKPVMADGKIRSMHGGYLFFFNSVDNRRAFEVRQYYDYNYNYT